MPFTCPPVSKNGHVCWNIYALYMRASIFHVWQKNGFFFLGGWVEDRACMSHVCYIVNLLLLYYTCRMYIFNDPCRHLWIHALYMQACIGHIYLNMYALYMWACIWHIYSNMYALYMPTCIGHIYSNIYALYMPACIFPLYLDFHNILNNTLKNFC